MNYDIIDKVIADRLKRSRNSRSITQRDFAEMLGIAYSSYACYENALRSMPVDVFYKACKLLGLDPHEVAREASEAYAKTFEK